MYSPDAPPRSVIARDGTSCESGGLLGILQNNARMRLMKSNTFIKYKYNIEQLKFFNFRLQNILGKHITKFQ